MTMAALLGFWARHALREKYAVWPWEGILQEFFCWCFCGCCSLCQEFKTVMKYCDDQGNPRGQWAELPPQPVPQLSTQTAGYGHAAGEPGALV